MMRHCIATPRVSIASCAGNVDAAPRAAGDPARQQDLAAHQVDAGHHLGDRVLDLNARVHLDEIERAAVDVDEKLDRAGSCDSRPIAQRRTAASQMSRRRPAGERDARRDFDDLLMAPLHRAVALPQMHEVAVRIAEDLHLDVLRALRCTRSRNTSDRPKAAAASRCASASLLGEVLVARDDAHAAAAAAEARLDRSTDSRSIARRPRPPTVH